VDVITMHVDSPSTVISTAESRGVYSIGYQNLAAQQFAPEYWISGTGFTLGGKLTWLTSTVLDGTWEPIFLRCGIADGCMAIAPFGPKVPQEVQDLVMQAKADIESDKIVVFKGPIKDQDGNVKVADGEVLGDDAMGSVDWFVEGVVSSPSKNSSSLPQHRRKNSADASSLINLTQIGSSVRACAIGSARVSRLFQKRSIFVETDGFESQQAPRPCTDVVRKPSPYLPGLLAGSPFICRIILMADRFHLRY
jgi:hypothetical protein